MDAPIGVRMANKFACHSEGAKRPKNPYPLRPVRPWGLGERIATSASPPRNDRGCDEVHSRNDTERNQDAERYALHCARIEKGGYMAERRMFHMSVVESDAFLDLPIGAQALYFHIGMHADDDGFVSGPRQITRKLRTNKKYLDMLIEQEYLLQYEDIVVVRHWLISNTLKADRLRMPQYLNIASELYLAEDRTYTKEKGEERLSLLESRKVVLDSKRNPKVSEGKVRKEKVREENISEDKVREGNPTPPGADAACEGWIHDSQKEKKSVINLTPREISDLMEKMGSQAFSRYVLKLSDFIRQNNAKVKDHYATILKWWREDGFDNENLEVSL